MADTPKFTPGPWFAQFARVKAGSTNPLDDGEPISIADCDMDMRVDHDTTACANANLIAAAPDLYEALRAIVSAGSSGPVVNRATLYLKAEAVLARAEGRQ